MTGYSVYKNCLKDVTMPCAFVDMEAFRRNTHAILTRAGQKKIRIATKSIRSFPLIEELLRLPQVIGVMAYHPREAAWLAGKGVRDILIGYPVVSAASLRTLARCIKEGATITLMVDEPAHLAVAEKVAAQEAMSFQVCIDVDMSVAFPGLWFGVKRSPIRSAKQVRDFIRTLNNYPHLSVRGMMGYEAELAGVPDSGAGIKSALVRMLKSRTRKKLTAFWQELFQTSGITFQLVNSGGTGSLEFSAALEGITEVTAGSGFFSPALFDHYADFRHEPAAGFAAEITRIPEKGVFTCHGGGYVASGSPGSEKVPQVWLPEGARLIPHEAAGEVQTPVVYNGSVNLSVGDPILFRHAKAGELCERFDELLLISEGKITGTARTYRGEGLNFG